MTHNPKLITCVVPVGFALPIVRKLKSEKGLNRTIVNNARGVGKQIVPSAHRLGDQTEKQILTIVVDGDRADEIFEYVYQEAQIGRPHGGIMYMAALRRATLFSSPDLPDEK